MTFDQLNSSHEEREDEPKMMPLGTDESFEVSDEVDLVGSGTGKKRVNDATIVLIVTLFVAFAGLAGMRWMASRSAGISMDQTVETKVSTFIQSLTGAVISDRPGSMVALDAINPEELADDRTDGQVDLDDLKKNPFVIGAQSRVDDQPNEDWTAQSEEERRAAERQRLKSELDRQCDELRLTSIMGGADNFIAVINNEVIRPGMITGPFKVKSIQELSVTLEAEGFEFQLSLE